MVIILDMGRANIIYRARIKHRASIIHRGIDRSRFGLCVGVKVKVTVALFLVSGFISRVMVKIKVIA